MTRKHEPIPRHELEAAIKRSDNKADRGYFRAGELATMLGISVFSGLAVGVAGKALIGESDHKPEVGKKIEVVVQTPEEPTVINVHVDK